MSSVTDMFILIGDSPDGLAEEVAPRVAHAVAEFADGVDADVPVISLARDDWARLQGGRKTAGGAALWFGWNYAKPDELIDHLKAQGFKNVTVWSHEEHDSIDGLPPRVVSW